MKVGDLVRYVDPDSFTLWDGMGVILREIPGTGQNKVVYWFRTKYRGSYPARYLEVISESR